MTTIDQNTFEELQRKAAAFDAAQAMQPEETTQPVNATNIIISKPEEPKGLAGFIKKNGGKILGGVTLLTIGYIAGKKHGIVPDAPKVIDAVDVTDIV